MKLGKSHHSRPIVVFGITFLFASWWNLYVCIQNTSTHHSSTVLGIFLALEATASMSSIRAEIGLSTRTHWTRCNYPVVRLSRKCLAVCQWYQQAAPLVAYSV
jgi:hypothetical protein